MPRPPLNPSPMTPAERQRKYLTKKQQAEQALHDRIFAHHVYRITLNVALARVHHESSLSMSPIDKLSVRTGIDRVVIEHGRREDCGLFTTEELAKLRKAMPHVPSPRI